MSESLAYALPWKRLRYHGNMHLANKYLINE